MLRVDAIRTLVEIRESNILREDIKENLDAIINTICFGDFDDCGKYCTSNNLIDECNSCIKH